MSSFDALKSHLDQLAASANDADMLTITQAAQEALKALASEMPTGNATSQHHYDGLSVSRLWLTGLGEAYQSLLMATPHEHQDPDHASMLEQLQVYLGEAIINANRCDHEAMIHSPWKSLAIEMAQCVKAYLADEAARTPSKIDHVQQLIHHATMDTPHLSYPSLTHSINTSALSPSLGKARRARLSAQISTLADAMQQTDDPALQTCAKDLFALIQSGDALPLYRANVAHCLYGGDKATLVLNLNHSDASALMNDPNLRWVWLSRHPEDGVKI